MEKIINFIEHLECPSLNAIMFSDETIQLLDVVVDWDFPANYTIKIGAQTSINTLQNEGDLYWSSCAILVELIDIGHSIEIIAGEASYGSEGFIAVLDLDSKKTIWLAFFNDSNPFNELKIIGEELHATSTMGCIWIFKVINPVDFIVLPERAR